MASRQYAWSKALSQTINPDRISTRCASSINDRSGISAHEDANDGVFTNYLDLRSFIVTEKTIGQLLELLSVP